jgi:regulator of replication initiation timing
MSSSLQLDAETVLSSTLKKPVSVTSFESDGEEWGATFLYDKGVAIAFYRDGELIIEQPPVEIPASFVEPVIVDDPVLDRMLDKAKKRKDTNEQRGDPSVVVETFDKVNTDSKGGCDCMPGMKRYKGMDMEEEVFDAFKAMEDELETIKKDMKGMIPKKDSAYEEKVDALAGENAGLRTRVAALEVELGTRMDASAVEEAAQARLNAYMECVSLLPDGVKFDATISPIEWRKAAIASANPSVDLENRSDDFVNGMFSTMQVVTAKADAKVDAAKAEGFRRILDSAAVAGHHGSSAESPDDLSARQDAEDIEAINNIFAFKGGSN